ncbi:filamentous haemagglutinin outer membrane protein [Rivularia sp. IAM M-261]|nr:filamentous haemagglutinin outer membrane protein [Rivularia sp. IAM M-261]
MCNWFWKLGLMGALSVVLQVPVLTVSKQANAQVRTDSTLGGESSVIVPNVVVDGLQSERVDGGAIRGANLFHSFQEFNVVEGRGVYFSNPSAVENIFSRVTGANSSNILGRLGVLGNANLYLMNPNGIVFGQNASLDVEGSFVATTANAIKFGNTGIFSASEPASSNSLSINPSVLFYNVLNNAEIVNRSVNGLNVNEGRSLLLVGGKVKLEGGVINAPDGRVELGGLNSPGDITINQDGNNLGLSFPNNIDKADISLTNASEVNVSSNSNAGNIKIDAKSLLIRDGTRVNAGVIGNGNGGKVDINAQEEIILDNANNNGLPTSILVNVNEGAKGNAGDIKITTGNLSVTNGALIESRIRGTGDGGKVDITTRSLSMKNGGRIDAVTNGNGDAGKINIKAQEEIILDNANNNGLPTSILANVDEGTKGNAGDIKITTGNLSVTNGALIESRTRGTGNGGQIIIDAKGKISFDGSNGDFNSGAYSGVEKGAEGNGGNISIKTGALSVKDRGKILAQTNGQGSAGSIKITASDTVSIAGFDGDTVGSNVINGSNGDGNDVEITARKVNLEKNAIVSASISDGTGKNGLRAQAGNVKITAHEELNSNNSLIFSDVGSPSFANGGTISITAPKIILDNQGQLITAVQSGGIGDAGNVEINTGSLSMKNGARINVGTSGNGDGGTVNIKAQEEIILDNANNNGLPTSILSNVEEGANGNAGDIKITTGNLSVTNGALIESRIRSTGNGGQITINANNKIFFDGSRDIFNSGAFSSVERTGVGKGGNIQITTDSLSLTNGAQLIASTFGQGNAGSVLVKATDDVSLASALISSTVDSAAVGNGGKVEINAGTLSLKERAQILTSVGEASNGQPGGRGDAGDVKINVTGTLKIEGVNIEGVNADYPTAIFSSVGGGATGDAGNIDITANSVSLDNRGALYAQAQNGAVGNAGNITIKTGSFSAATTSQIAVNSLATGNAGKIKIEAGEFSMTSNAALRADIDENGKASEPGSIDLIVDGTISLIGGKTEIAPTGESTRITLGILPKGKGPGGNLTIKANSLVLKDGASIKASTQGEGAAGNININTNVVDISGSSPISGLSSGLFTSTDNSSNAGNIIINAETFRIAEGAGLSARTRGSGQGGNITVNARYFEAMNGGQLVTTTTGNKRAGNILIDAKNRVTISGIDQKYNTRFAQVQANEERIRTAPDSNPERTSFRLSSIANNITETGAGSGLFAQTDKSNGDAGNVIITTQQLTLTDQAQISAGTSSSGQGGNINIRGNSLTLNKGEINALAQGLGNAGSINIDINGLLNATDSKIITSATQSSGGASAIKAGNIRLYGNSDITTNVGSGAGGGGNITLTANSIIAFGDSDILAFARDGKGGDVSLKTPAFFGQNYKAAPRGTEPSTLDGNNRVDINASGAVSGTVTLPDTSFIQNSLSELPENLIDTGSLIANSCIARANSQQQGTFIITGSGALPSRPGDALMSQYTFGSVRTNNVSASSRRPWQKGDPIIEPQGAYRLRSGRLVLSRECR